MRMSISTMSGRSARTWSTASRPSPASPTTSIAGSASRIMRNPARTSAWSSTSRMRITTASPRPAARRERRSRSRRRAARPRACRRTGRRARAFRRGPGRRRSRCGVESPSSETSSCTVSFPKRTSTCDMGAGRVLQARSSGPPGRCGTPTGRRPGEAAGRSPSTRSVTGSPAASTCATRWSRCFSPGCGVSATAGASSPVRITPNIRRISVSACRPICSTESSASRSRC